jgi:hypothetical protein
MQYREEAAKPIIANIVSWGYLLCHDGIKSDMHTNSAIKDDIKI